MITTGLASLLRTIVDLIGFSSLIGALLAHRLAVRQERVKWVNDNKRQEWRELIDELDNSFHQMEYAFGNTAVSAGYDTRTDPMAGIGKASQVIRDRIFIATALAELRIIQKWEELRDYVVSATSPPNPPRKGAPTITGFRLKANALIDQVLEGARRDLKL